MKQNNLVLILLIGLIVVLGFYLLSQKSTSNTPAETLPEADPVTETTQLLFTATETYAGTTEDGALIVFEHKDYTSYQLTKGGVVTTGELNTERGWDTDENATVFVLNWDQDVANQTVFVKKSGATALTELNTDRTEKTPTVTLELQ